MGKKSKVGKARKDRFYHLAKETGFRSRSAFKLIQLNRKYQFLEKCRVLIDLCAAPGGWLQVAAKYMPVSSIIIGVDLVPIKPIKNVVTLQEDITTVRCRQSLAKELQHWKANCVLNDGAPNVGSAWVQDAFSQAHLTLSALQIACEFLVEGGWFITKVFRSKDYQSLMWVFQQLFKKVHATKPQASRLESAEIFVTCQGYLAPDKIDPKLFEPKHVFKDIDQEEQPKVTLKTLEKSKKPAVGYEEGDTMLYKTTSVADFIMSDEPLQLLSSVNKLIFDEHSKLFLKHPDTSEEVCHCCEDIKVLGRRELKLLVTWRNKMKAFLNEVDPEKKSNDSNDEGVGKGPLGSDDEELSLVDRQVEALKQEEVMEAKRQRRKRHKEKMRQKERIAKKLQTHHSGETMDGDDMELFKLSTIKSKQHLNTLENTEMLEEETIVEEGVADDRGGVADGQEYYSEEELSDNSREDEQHTMDTDSTIDNPLVVTLGDDQKESKTNRAAHVWFQKPLFARLEDDHDMDTEVELSMRKVKQKKSSQNTEMMVNQYMEETADVKATEVKDVDDSDTDSDSIESCKEQVTKSKKESNAKSDTFDVVPLEKSLKRPRHLDPEGLALGALLKKSKKSREDLIESGYNRWANNDDNLPDWFVQDEAKHCQKQLPVTKEMVQDFKARLKEINTRPIKKIAEAKARKKRRTLKRLEKIKKKVEGVVDTPGILDSEKMQQLKKLYQKAKQGSSRHSKEVQYVVAKKGIGKRVSRPAGVSGRFKVVDPRMKKDSRKQKYRSKSARKKNKYS